MLWQPPSTRNHNRQLLHSSWGCRRLYVPFHTVMLEDMAGPIFWHFMDGLSSKVSTNPDVICHSNNALCLKNQHCNNSSFQCEGICGIRQYILLSLSTARRNLKTSDLLFVTGKLDFFPHPDCQDSFVDVSFRVCIFPSECRGRWHCFRDAAEDDVRQP